VGDGFDRLWHKLSRINQPFGATHALRMRSGIDVPMKGRNLGRAQPLSVHVFLSEVQVRLGQPGKFLPEDINPLREYLTLVHGSVDATLQVSAAR
jgi:hypothetical protein